MYKEELISQKKIVAIVLSVLMMTAWMGCTGKFVPIAYKSMLVMDVVYDTTLKTAADLYKDNLISKVKKDKIIEAARIFRESYDLLARALAAYEASKDKNDMEKALLALEKCLDSYDNFVNLYVLITGRAVPEEIPERKYLEDKLE